MPTVSVDPVVRRFLRSQSGASLVDALVAAGLVVTITAGVAHLLVWTRRTASFGGVQTAAVLMAGQKMEALRALSWTVDPAGLPITDRTTDLSREAPAAGGAGLQGSPGGTLERNVPGYVDFLGADGAWRGTGLHAPPGAAFVRRWSVAPWWRDPPDSLVLTVLVVPLGADSAPRARASRGARVQTILTRVIR